MAEKIGSKIGNRTGNKDLIEILADQLSGSELNSILLEVFDRRRSKLTAPELLKQYASNRFVQPAETNYIRLLEKSIETLKIFSAHRFTPLHLSPLSSLGSCSVLAPVGQDKVVTALRNCEILSDATNAIALYISLLKKKKDNVSLSPDEHIKYSSVQRHVRAQPVSEKGFSSHFSIGCLVSSGTDTGSYTFEKKAIAEHFAALTDVLHSVFSAGKVYYKLQKRPGYTSPDHLVAALLDHLHTLGLDVRVDETAKQNNYYHGIQFKTVIAINGNEIEIADGGFVNWTQQLLSNKKERLCISGFGLELLLKFEERLI